MMKFAQLPVMRQIAVLGMACAIAGPAAALPPAGSAPALEFGGFEIAQSLWPCSVIVNNALADAALKVDEAQSTEGPFPPGTFPVKVAGNGHVTIGVMCLPTWNANITRVVVTAASSNAATAAAFRNAVRTDIIGRAKGGSGSHFAGPTAGTAPVLVVGYRGTGGIEGQVVGHRHPPRAPNYTPDKAAAALQAAGLQPQSQTPGGEVAGGNANVSVVVVASVCGPDSCSLMNYTHAVVASSSDSSTANSYRDQIQKSF